MLKKIKLKNRGVKISSGNEACAEGALAAGCKFFAGYPITPATEVLETLSKRMLEEDGILVQMEDELSSICSIIGARWGGSKAMTATSGPGFSLMQEGLGYAIVSETPIVILNVQRGGPSTGQPTASGQGDIYQAKYGSHGDYELIALVPSSIQEAFDFTIKAFNLAEEFRVPVIILSDEIIGHMREKLVIPEFVEIFDEKFEGKCDYYFKPDENKIPPRISFFEGHNVLVDGQLHDERGIRAGHIPKKSKEAVERFNEKILFNIDKIIDIKQFDANDAEILLITYGSVFRSALQAVKLARQENIKAGLIKVNTVWPFPEEEIKKVCKKAKKVIVAEMNVGKYVREVERVIGQNKVIFIPSLGGVLHRPTDLLKIIKEVNNDE